MTTADNINTTISRANQTGFHLLTQDLKQPLVVDVCVYDVAYGFSRLLHFQTFAERQVLPAGDPREDSGE